MPTEFEPLRALAGGGLIGLAAVLLMLGFGRILGATGILAGFLTPASLQDWSWRAALLLGMASGPLAYAAVTGAMPTIAVPVGTPMLLAGGVLVGLGVTFGSGCTSGHGVCGLARLSPRSLAATLTFMATAGAAVYAVRHVFGG